MPSALVPEIRPRKRSGMPGILRARRPGAPSDTIPTPTLPLKEREEAWRGAAGVGRCAGRSCVRSALAGGRGGGRGHLLVGLGGGRYGGVDDFLDLADALQRRRGLGLELG